MQNEWLRRRGQSWFVLEIKGIDRWMVEVSVDFDGDISFYSTDVYFAQWVISKPKLHESYEVLLEVIGCGSIVESWPIKSACLRHYGFFNGDRYVTFAADEFNDILKSKYFDGVR